VPCRLLTKLSLTSVLARRGVRVAVIEYRPSWAAEFSALATDLPETLGDGVVGIDHVGSTSVPGVAGEGLN
jgi:GrpB-like predicted nucleotidyltransferase (UPF0157 family)